MNFGQAIQAGFRNYAVFTGRASRAEYWYWFLFVSLVRMALSIATGNSENSAANLDIHPFNVLAAIGGMALPALWSLATFLPTLGVTVRRLRDAGYNPRVLLWGIAPFVLSIVTMFVAVAAIFAPGPLITDANALQDLARIAPTLLVGGLTVAVSLGISIWFIIMLAKPSKPELEVYDRPDGIGE